jgi:hypothetical protein
MENLKYLEWDKNMHAIYETLKEHGPDGLQSSQKHVFLFIPEFLKTKVGASVLNKSKNVYNSKKKLLALLRVKLALLDEVCPSDCQDLINEGVVLKSEVENEGVNAFDGVVNYMEGDNDYAAYMLLYMTSLAKKIELLNSQVGHFSKMADERTRQVKLELKAVKPLKPSRDQEPSKEAPINVFKVPKAFKPLISLWTKNEVNVTPIIPAAAHGDKASRGYLFMSAMALGASLASVLAFLRYYRKNKGGVTVNETSPVTVKVVFSKVKKTKAGGYKGAKASKASMKKMKLALEQILKQKLSLFPSRSSDSKFMLKFKIPLDLAPEMFEVILKKLKTKKLLSKHLYDVNMEHLKASSEEHQRLLVRYQ